MHACTHAQGQTTHGVKSQHTGGGGNGTGNSDSDSNMS
jgi:hypothetical protein